MPNFDAVALLADGYGNEIHFVKQKGKPMDRERTTIDETMIVGNWYSSTDNAIIQIEMLSNGITHTTLNGVLVKSKFDNKYSIALRYTIDGHWSIDNENLVLNFDKSSSNFITQVVNYIEQDENNINEVTNIIKSTFEDDFNKAFSGEKPWGQFISVSDTNLVFSDFSFKKNSGSKECVLGTIEEEDSYLITQGLSGTFVVLKWCDWDCTKSLDDFQIEFENQRNNPKQLILLPISVDEFGEIIFGTPFEMSVPEMMLGLRLKDISVNNGYYLMEIESRLNLFK